MDPLIGLATGFAIAVGFAGGWYASAWNTRRINRAYARQMMAAVKASKSRRDPADMLSYDNRQRTTAPGSGTIPARQGRVRFRTRSPRR